MKIASHSNRDGPLGQVGEEVRIQVQRITQQLIKPRSFVLQETTLARALGESGRSLNTLDILEIEHFARVPRRVASLWYGSFEEGYP